MIRLARIPGMSLLLSALLLFAVYPAQSQSRRSSPAEFSLAPLEQGSLTLWIVYRNPNQQAPPRRMQASAPGAPQYREQTAGSFGQDSSTFGQTAGSAGQTAGSFGTPASSTGQPASNTGQTAGSFGRTASSVGTNAGDAGQTAGSFGTSTTDLAKAASAANDPSLPDINPRRTAEWDAFIRDVERRFPQVQLKVEDVYDTDLQARLEATARTPNRPDVLLGRPLPALWSNPPLGDLRFRNAVLGIVDSPKSGLYQRFGITTLGMEVRVPQTEADVLPSAPQYEREVAILADPAHGGALARAFYLWVAEGGLSTPVSANSADEEAVIALSKEVVRGSLTGGVTTQIDATAVHVKGNSAMVALRVIESAPKAFGVVHAVVVVQRNSSGKWQLLQLSPTLSERMQTAAMNLWRTATAGRALSDPLDSADTKLLGISGVSPQDGENSTAQPQLGWDNLGGASMQVVEWSRPGSLSNLFFVPDSNSHLRTHVVARFAASGAYRWRVWSVGPDGEIILSPWKTFSVVAR